MLGLHKRKLVVPAGFVQDVGVVAGVCVLALRLQKNLRAEARSQPGGSPSAGRACSSNRLALRLQGLHVTDAVSASRRVRMLVVRKIQLHEVTLLLSGALRLASCRSSLFDVVFCSVGTYRCRFWAPKKTLGPSRTLMSTQHINMFGSQRCKIHRWF